MADFSTLLPSPSEEQKDIISHFAVGFNLKVEAVAGSGKTTTLLWLCHTAKERFGVNCLILTYNRALKDEINQKLAICNLNSHCGAHTYHSLASVIYKTSIHNDVLLRQYLHGGTATTNLIPSIVLIDEVQDMNADYHHLINKILSPGSILVLVGDRRQCINTYAGANIEYLVNYDKYFSTGRPWKELALRTSYRLTPAVANFINKHILNDNLIIGGNQRDKNIQPIYKYDVYNLKHLLEKMVDKYGPDEVAILTPSVKNVGNPKSPLGRLLSQKSKLLLTVIDEYTAPESTSGKVIITTFNSMKGRERKCVFVTNFDESYFDYYSRDWNKEIEGLPNIIYVAASRARESLIVVQGDKKPPFRTIKMKELHYDCIIDGHQKESEKSSLKAQANRVTNLTRHRNLDDVTEMLALMTTRIISGPTSALTTNDVIQFPGYSEDVRIFYGTLIPLYCQHLMNAASPWLQQETVLVTKGEIPSFNEDGQVMYFPTKMGGFTDVCQRLNQLFNIEDRSLKQWMEIVVLNTALENKCHFYKDQITHYDWIDEAFIKSAATGLLSTIPPDGEFESKLGPKNKYNLEGITDYMTKDEIWEFKCSSSLTDEHKIQCAAYLALNYIEKGKQLPGKLFNIKTGEILEIGVTNPSLFLDILMRKTDITIP